MKKQTLLVLGVVVVAAVAGAWFARSLQSSAPPAAEPLQYGTLIPDPQPMPAFALLDQRGAPIDATALQGQWSLLFFGFTHCPEICPTTLALLTDVRKRLGASGVPSAPRIVLVSVDPERDTPEVMATYVSAFDPSIVGVTGTVESIDAFAQSMGVAHRKVPMGPDDYMMDHTAAVFVIDPQGRRAAIFTPPLDAANLTTDLRKLIGPAS